MREKVSTAYFLDDPRKFSSMEEAEKELNRLRAVCVRLKKKQGEDIAFMLGLSVTDSQYMGKMGYQKSMRYGGKKVFICSERRIHNGERVEPCTDKPPHIHIMVQGYGASTAAERIIQTAARKAVRLLRHCREAYRRCSLQDSVAHGLLYRYCRCRGSRSLSR